MSKHTPGPWYAVGSWVEVDDDNAADICNCSAESMGQKRAARPPEEEEANARLIAAAPELLDALRALQSIPPFDGTQKASIARRETKRAARAVVAKALGEKE
jgi:hypothetical protein